MPEAPLLRPVFPLPNVVFFPKTLLPLHIFEPRYRQMIADALRGDQSLCVALLKPGWEADYEGSPEVYPVACLGRIVQHEALPDGRYDIVVHGESRVMIEGYERLTPYRVARLRPLDQDAAWIQGPDATAETMELLRLFRQMFENQPVAAQLAAALGPHLSPEGILNSVAMNLNVEAKVKQFLLEIDSVGARYRSVLKILREALTTQDRIDRVRHLYPEDPRSN
ncbi:MAG TPA: LON peptidase substrate-binding domain-containing protein [Candidatus Eisenbacteria bacterium]